DLLARRQRDAAALAERPVELADLVALRQVAVEVVLAVELAPRCDLGAERERGAHGERERLLVEDRQGARLSGAARAGQRVRRRAEPVLAAAEELRARVELAVDLEPDDGDPFRRGRAHARSLLVALTRDLRASPSRSSRRSSSSPGSAAG